MLAPQIFTVSSRPNHFQPWQNHPKRESNGTGFVVRKGLIMTNAHVVSDASYVSVKRHGSGSKFRADVVAVGHECDLALLAVQVRLRSTPAAALCRLIQHSCSV